MTPFEEWWEQQIQERYGTVRPELTSVYRANALRGWNAALDAVLAEAGYERVWSGGINVGIFKVGEPQMDNLRVTP